MDLLDGVQEDKKLYDELDILHTDCSRVYSKEIPAAQVIELPGGKKTTEHIFYGKLNGFRFSSQEALTKAMNKQLGFVVRLCRCWLFLCFGDPA